MRERENDMFMYIYIYMYTYVENEREREEVKCTLARPAKIILNRGKKKNTRNIKISLIQNRCMCMCIYIYICRERERGERDLRRNSNKTPARPTRAARPACWRRARKQKRNNKVSTPRMVYCMYITYRYTCNMCIYIYI